MASKFKIDTKLDLREFNKVLKKLHNIETWEAQAGFSDKDKHPRSGESAAYIATINNYGGIQWSDIVGDNVTIPSRPFMDFAMMYDTQTIFSLMAAQFNAFILGSINSQQALKPISLKLSQNIEWALGSEMLYEANRPLTVSLKGFDRPLYETGWLINHVKTWTQKVAK